LVGIAAALGIGATSIAASFPTGFGFGAGYGAGVRTGYDIIYPRLAPFVRDILDAVFGGGTGRIEDTVDALGPREEVPKPDTGGRVGKADRLQSAVNPCEQVRNNARSLKNSLSDAFNQRTQLTTKLNNTSGSRERQRIDFQISALSTQIRGFNNELNAVLGNPNNRQCVEGMSFT